MKSAAANDPGIRFNDKTKEIETIYTYQQIIDLHASDSFRARLDDLAKDKNGAWGPSPAQDAIKAFGTDSYKKQLKVDTKEVTKISKERLEKYKFNDFDAVFSPARRTSIDQGLAGADAAGGARVLLQDQGFNGFTLGEGHSDASSKKYLIDNMAALKGAGVNTLYIEHVRFREYQGMVDEWMRSPAINLDGPLAKFVDASDKKYGLKGRDTLRGVLESAKANQIRVVGIDDALTNGKSTGKLDLEERVAMMNPFAEHVIRTDTGRAGGKYVILVGQAHNNTHAGKGGGIPGLSQLLEIPAVTVGADGKLVRDPEQSYLRVERPR